MDEMDEIAAGPGCHHYRHPLALDELAADRTNGAPAWVNEAEAGSVQGPARSADEVTRLADGMPVASERRHDGRARHFRQVGRLGWVQCDRLVRWG